MPRFWPSKFGMMATTYKGPLNILQIPILLSTFQATSLSSSPLPAPKQTNLIYVDNCSGPCMHMTRNSDDHKVFNSNYSVK